MISFDSENDLEMSLVESLEGGYNPISDEHVDYFGRQVNLAGYGIVDLVTVSVEMEVGRPTPVSANINLIELKNTTFKPEHVTQIARYKIGLDRAVESGKFGDILIQVECTLVFKKTFPDRTDNCFFIQASEWLNAYEMSFNFKDGVTFNRVHGWKPEAENLDSIVSKITEVMEA